MKYSGCNQLSSVPVTTAVTKILENKTNTEGQRAITFPLHALSGYLYVLVTPTNGTKPDGSAIDAAFVQNYGTQFEAADKIATINICDVVDVFAVTSTGSFTVYPSRWV